MNFIYHLSKHNHFIKIVAITLSVLLIISVGEFREVKAENKTYTNLPLQNKIVYKSNKNLSDTKISERFTCINSSYGVGEPFSKEDAEFVKSYIPKQEPTNCERYLKTSGSNIVPSGFFLYKGTTTKSFNKSKRKYNVKVKFSGTIKSHINSVSLSDQWYSGDTTAKITKGKSRIVSIKTTVSHTAYGVLGNSGTYIGIVHKSSLTSSSGKKAKYNYLDKKKKYSALLTVYNYTTTYVTIATKGGSFNLYGI